jgi:hypothetical protein
MGSGGVGEQFGGSVRKKPLVLFAQGGDYWVISIYFEFADLQRG